MRIWLAGVLLGGEFMDTTDSRPLESVNSMYDSDSYKKYGIEKQGKFPKDVKYSVYAEYRQSPLPEIARANDGKFILDKDSDEGGFTSPRRPARGVIGSRKWQEWTSHPEAGWTTAVSGVESGVYHVRQGTTSTHVHPRQPHPPRLSLKSEQSGTNTYELPTTASRSPVIYENSMIARRRPYSSPYYFHSKSPHFGEHEIPNSPLPVLSPKGRLRSSSPGPLSNQWRQLTELASFNEISSVKQPSSVERSFPSTVLSSFHTTNQHTPSIHAMSMEAQSPYFQFPTHSAYAKEYPSISPLYRYPNTRTVHLVGAQIHEPPPQFRTQPSFHPYYLPPPRYYSPWGTPQRSMYDRRFGWISPQQAAMMSRHAFLGSGQHVHHIPHHSQIITSPYTPSFVPDASRHYANIPFLRRDPYIHQRTPRTYPRMLLNPNPLPVPSSENQKPLATSSPPRLRPRLRPRQSYIGDHVQTLKPSSHPNRFVVNTQRPQNISELNASKRQAHRSNILPYPPHKDITSIRNRDNNRRIRHHSAPNLSISGQEDVEVIRRVRFPPGRSRRNTESKSRSNEVSYDLSQEMSHDQSPDSSGFGSKNTSQQQSSSQSGQSLSALGLDTSRVSEISPKSYKHSDESWESRAMGYDRQIWPLPRLPPSYEQWLARQMQPQFRVPTVNYEYPTFSKPEVLLSPCRSNRSELERTQRNNALYDHAIVAELENDVFDSVDIPDVPERTNTLSTAAAALDISVDNHYEFDTMLSPTPIDETLMPASGEWSSSGGGNGNNSRRLSDSELYGTGSSIEDRRRRSQESMEERVAAMKQEFLEYRRRQASRSDTTHLESVC